LIEKLVYKYELEPGADIRIPAGPSSRFMKADMQLMPVMWVEHAAEGLDKDGKPQPIFDCEWEVLLAGTGVLIPSEWSFLDTVQMAVAIETTHPTTGDPLTIPKFIVWHVYYRVAKDSATYPQGSMTDASE